VVVLTKDVLRVDVPKAWAVWLEKNVAGEAERLLAAPRTFAAFDQEEERRQTDSEPKQVVGERCGA
jgi:hypothetical protein